MSLSIFETFKSLFMAQQPKDYHKWQEERDSDKLSSKLKTGSEALEELRGDRIVQPLVEVRKKVDELQFTVLHMIPRWQETEASKVKDAIGSVQEQVNALKKEVTTAETKLSPVDSRSKPEQRQLEGINADIGGIQETLDKQLEGLDKRSSLKIGEGSDFTNYGLKQGWVPDSKGEGTFQYQSKEEWENLQKRGVDQKLTTKDMQVVVKGVHLQEGQDPIVAKERLEKERATSVKLRGDMTKTFKERLKHEGPVKDGVINNIDFAKKLAGMLEDPSIKPEDLLKKFKVNGGEEGGLLNRIIGTIEGQGQFAEPKPKSISEGIGKISADSLEDGDANKIQQFISGFVDGLTEVNETNKTAQDQFDLLWEKMEEAFKLKKEDKAKLMERVDVYKKLAGGLADTSQSGKGTRKGFTRKGKMPVEKTNTIEDPEALIANDISGSMHSQFLAMELAETLSGKAKDELGQPIKGFKSAGSSVQVKDKDVLDSRMLDALTMTAGGKFDGGTGADFVMHTAYEMINGVQAITGVANKVTQKTATQVMEALQSGKSFSQAMEEALPDEVFPWQLEDAGTVNKRAASALETATKASTSENDLVPAAVMKLVEDVLWMATDLDGPSEEDAKKIAEELKKGTTFTAALTDYFKKAKFPWG